MRIAGFDIGGANTDLAIINFDQNGDMEDIKVDFRYLPMWMKNEELGDYLIDLIGDEINQIDAVAVSMTAELVDAYETKKDGVLDIVKRVQDTFDIPTAYVGLSGMIDYSQVSSNPLQVAAANWIATSQIASIMSSDCIMVDVGSTTTDIIPIKNGSECARGRSDLERLGTGELVYSGTLRTNVAALVDKVPYDDGWFRVSSELFAISADVHHVLDNITSEEYSCDTPDGSGKTKKDSMRRISRVLCGDLDILSSSDIEFICDYIYNQQALKISEAIIDVAERNSLTQVITTGLGMNIIASKAAKIAEMDLIGMDEFLTPEECVVAPAVGTALMMGDYLKDIEDKY
ncbi:MAG: hydantoinase/oxoprolinase family protein [Methanobacteriaceae archaeon]|nr:hydantoinase/oxoprolinase family protein [Methanobacteriaceae archaeon]